MSTAMIDALQKNLGPDALNGPAILGKLVDELVLKGTLKSQVAALLNRWDKYHLKVSAAPAASFKAWIGQCSVRVEGIPNPITGGNIKSNDATAHYWASLESVDKLLENAGAVRQWGEASPTKTWRYIAKKFENDHLVADKKVGKSHAVARLGSNANVPASTSIEEIYAEPLSKFVGALNDAGVFQAVEMYLNTVKGWSIDDAKVDSIVWLTTNPVTAWTFKRKNQSVDDGTKSSGSLAFAVQADENDPNVRLLYHYSGIEANPAALKAPWELVKLDAVLGKLTKLDSQQRDKLRRAWPHVYFSA